MPYDRNADLPEGVRNALPASAQTVYRKAYNSAEARGFVTSRCARIAWGAVKNAGWRKPAGEGKWIKEADVDMTSEERLREAWGDLSSNDVERVVSETLRARVPVTDGGPTLSNHVWVRDLYEDHVIVEVDGDYLRYDFTVADGKVTVAKEGKEVHQTWATGPASKATAMAEALREGGDRLRESDNIREATLVPTEPNEEGVSPGSVLIRAGTNKTKRRHYTPEFLKQHLARFDGAFCNVDHPSRTQERDRPEGSLGTLAAVIENPRFDDAQSVVLGDVRYLETAAGVDMKAAFASPAVRENAGLSIFSTERCRSQRQKIGEATVDVPVELLGDSKFNVDFVTRPTGGGSVTEIREEDDPMPELTDVTMEELVGANPDLVEAIGTAAVEAAQTDQAEQEEAKAAEAKLAEEEAAKLEQETASPSESDRVTATEKELAEVKQQLRVADGEKLLRGKLAEAGLMAEGEKLVEADFLGTDCADAEKFGAEVDARIDQVKGLIKEAAEAQHVTVPGGVEESDREPIDVSARIREAHGIESEDDTDSGD